MTIIHPYDHAWRYNAVTPDAVADLLAGPEGEEVRLNVKRGAGWLAERDLNWAEEIIAAVECETFNLGSCERCAVGTVLGDYDDHFGWDADEREGVQSRDDAIDLGFLVDDAPDSHVRWAATEQAWVDYAYEQAALR